MIAAKIDPHLANGMSIARTAEIDRIKAEARANFKHLFTKDV